jgi:predicted transcriptional regulator
MEPPALDRTPLDDVDFLARSPHRVRVLGEIAEGSRIRRDLHDETGISQPTLGRVLGGFEDRGWVEREGQDYALTPVGSLVAEAFATLHETVETAQRLQRVAPYLPIEALDFDLELLANATITTPDPPNVMAHVHRGAELVGDADAVTWLVGNYYLDSFEAQRELVLERGQSQEIIMTRESFERMLSHPGVVETVRELIGSGGVTVYTFSGDLPCSVGVVDDVAILTLYNDEGVPCALVDSTNETILAWATETVGDYRDRSDLVTLDDLPPEA